MIELVLLRTPVWVWGLLAALLALGLWQRRARRVRRGQLLALPLAMMALGLWTMAPGWVAQPLAAALWLAAIAASVWLGLRLPRPATARWLADEQRLFLPGSWVPLLIIVAIFSLRYATAVGLGLHPEWRSLPQLHLPLAVVFGGLGGIFLGRALGLLKLTQPTIAGHGPARPV